MEDLNYITTNQKVQKHLYGVKNTPHQQLFYSKNHVIKIQASDSDSLIASKIIPKTLRE